jgi:hypothetical protein
VQPYSAARVTSLDGIDRQRQPWDDPDGGPQQYHVTQRFSPPNPGGANGGSSTQQLYSSKALYSRASLASVRAVTFETR